MRPQAGQFLSGITVVAILPQVKRLGQLYPVLQPGDNITLTIYRALDATLVTGPVMAVGDGLANYSATFDTPTAADYFGRWDMTLDGLAGRVEFAFTVNDTP